MAKRPKDVAVFDRIEKWVADPEKFGELHPEDAEIFQRWSAADDLMRRYPARKTCAGLMIQKFNYSLAQAYRDLANAQVMFGTVNVYNKDYIKNWLIEDILKLIQTAKDKGDTKARSAAHANLIKVMGFDRDDKSLIRPEDIEPHRYFAVLVMGDQQLKIDLDDIDKVPITARQKLVHSLEREITEDIAFEMITTAAYEQNIQPESGSDKIDTP